jgi:hypothetical protein
MANQNIFQPIEPLLDLPIRYHHAISAKRDLKILKHETGKSDKQKARSQKWQN